LNTSVDEAHYGGASHSVIDFVTLDGISVLYSVTRSAINVPVDVFHEVFRHWSPEGMMAVPKCYMFSSYVVNIRSKENRKKYFRLIRINYDCELLWFFLAPNNLFHYTVQGIGHDI